MSKHIVRFQVLTAASMKFRFVFWDVLPCKIIVDSSPLWWSQHVILKRRSTIILHGSTSQKTNLNFILAAVRTWNLTMCLDIKRSGSCRCDGIMSQNCGHRRAYCSPPRWHTSMNSWRNDSNRRNPKNLEKNMFQYHSVHHKYHVDWHGREPGPPQRKADA
jgi:hypothetical protein